MIQHYFLIAIIARIIILYIYIISTSETENAVKGLTNISSPAVQPSSFGINEQLQFKKVHSHQLI